MPERGKKKSLNLEISFIFLSSFYLFFFSFLFSFELIVIYFPSALSVLHKSTSFTIVWYADMYLHIDSHIWYAYIVKSNNLLCIISIVFFQEQSHFIWIHFPLLGRKSKKEKRGSRKSKVRISKSLDARSFYRHKSSNLIVNFHKIDKRKCEEIEIEGEIGR